MRRKLLRPTVVAALVAAVAMGSSLAAPVPAHADSAGPPDSFFASLPTNFDTNVPLGGSFSAKVCSMTVSAALMHAMAPGEVYWGRCAGGLYVLTYLATPTTTWYAPAPPSWARTTFVLNSSVWRVFIMQARHLDSAI